MTTESETERWSRLARGRRASTFPKRFYKQVAISPAREILLDGRAVKTPLKKPLVLPTVALAEAVAAEWNAQTAVIDPHAMPLTKLANTAIDRAPAERPAIIAELMAYAGSDLVCYRADAPADLIARQEASWDPVLAWAGQALGAALRSTSGISHAAQPGSALAALERRIEEFDDYRLVALHAMTVLTGSVLLAAMVAMAGLAAEDAWAAAIVDERWQNEIWGEDYEAGERRKAQAQEFAAAARFVNLATS